MCASALAAASSTICAATPLACARVSSRLRNAAFTTSSRCALASLTARNAGTTSAGGETDTMFSETISIPVPNKSSTSDTTFTMDFSMYCFSVTSTMYMNMFVINWMNSPRISSRSISMASLFLKRNFSRSLTLYWTTNVASTKLKSPEMVDIWGLIRVSTLIECTRAVLNLLTRSIPKGICQRRPG